MLLVDDGSPDGSRAIAERVRRPRRPRCGSSPGRTAASARPATPASARRGAATSRSSTPTTCSRPGALGAAGRPAPARPAPTSSCGVGGALRQPHDLVAGLGRRRARSRRASGVTHRGVPPAAAQPLHLEQALPPRLLGRPGPVVPRGRGLRGPADRHPAVRPRQLDRRAPRRRLPLPRPRRQELDQPADRHPQGPPRPDRRLGGEPRRRSAPSCRRAVYEGWLQTLFEAHFQWYLTSPGHRRRRLLGRAGRDRAQPHRGCAAVDLGARPPPAPAGAGRARPARPPRRRPGVRPPRRQQAGAVAGHGPPGRRPARAAAPRRPRARRVPVRAPARAAARSPTPSRTCTGSTRPTAASASAISGWAFLAQGRPRPPTTQTVTVVLRHQETGEVRHFPSTEQPRAVVPAAPRRPVVRLRAGPLRRRAAARRARHRPRRRRVGGLAPGLGRRAGGRAAGDPAGPQRRRRRDPGHAARRR